MNAKIELEERKGYLRWVCDVCGEMQGKDGMRPAVKDGEGEINICRTCLEAGVDGAIERAIKHAERLQRYVDSLRTDYPVLLRSVIEWKTGKDYDAVFDAFEKQLQAEYEAGLR